VREKEGKDGRSERERASKDGSFGHGGGRSLVKTRPAKNQRKTELNNNLVGRVFGFKEGRSREK